MLSYTALSFLGFPRLLEDLLESVTHPPQKPLRGNVYADTHSSVPNPSTSSRDKPVAWTI